MEQARIFQRQEVQHVEDQLNRWLAASNPKIIRVLQSEGPSGGNVSFSSSLTITIFYEVPDTARPARLKQKK